MKKKLVVNSLLITLLFNGCSSLMPYQDDFKCANRTQTGNCKKMSEVYEDSINEKYDNELIIENNNTSKETFKSNILNNLVDEDNYKEEIPLYQKPKIAKMVVTGYLDTDGDWHKQEEIFMKIEKAKFIIPKNRFSIDR